MQQVILEGSAAIGIEPRLMVAYDKPTAVYLGAISKPAPSPVLQLGAYLDEANIKVGALPASLNRREKAAVSLQRMYVNDRMGCCVVSGKAHALGVWSGNDSDSGGLILATDQEIIQQYQGICGPGDNGCIITNVLDVMRTRGFTAGGKVYKIDGYVGVDWRNQTLVKAAQYLFGATTIGIYLPEEWTRSAVWDITNSKMVGGHDVTPVDYDEKGVYVSSWGRMYLMTWRAFTSTKYVMEYYALLSPVWYGNDKLAPCGVNATKLLEDLQKLDRGVVPDIDDPTPPPPTPVPPPSPSILKQWLNQMLESLKVQYASNLIAVFAINFVQSLINKYLTQQEEDSTMATKMTATKAEDTVAKLKAAIPEDCKVETLTPAAQSVISKFQELIAALQSGNFLLAFTLVGELFNLLTKDTSALQTELEAAGFDWSSMIALLVQLAKLFFGI